MYCTFQYVGTDHRGLNTGQCSLCGHTIYVPSIVSITDVVSRRLCEAGGKMPPPAKAFTDAELSELFPNDDPTLWGNRIKAVTDAIGFPPCGGCDTRRRWINAAHEWVRRNVTSTI